MEVIADRRSLLGDSEKGAWAPWVCLFPPVLFPVSPPFVKARVTDSHALKASPIQVMMNNAAIAPAIARGTRRAATIAFTPETHCSRTALNNRTLITGKLIKIALATPGVYCLKANVAGT